MALALLAAFGCGDEPQQAPSAGKPAAPPSAADVERAVTRLVEAGTPVPLPASGVLTADPNLARLVDRFDGAEIASGWSAPTTDPFLATAGPASGQRPGANALWRRETVSGVEFVALELRGFRFQAEEAGEVFLRARVRNSPFFILRWPRSPGMQIDVAEGGELSEYSVSTHGLAKWEGELDRASILAPVTPGQAEPEIEVELLGFVAKSSAFAAAAGVDRLRVDRVVREALYLRGSTQVAFAGLAAPPGARLSFGVAVLGAPLTLEVAAERGGTREVFATEQVGNVGHWRDVNLELSAGEGPARLTFAAEGPGESVLLVSNPTVYLPRENPRRVVFYLIDTLGAMHTSLDGYARRTTPQLERLAAEGVLFQNAFANGAYTPESVPSLMTSLHTRSHGLTEMFQRLSRDYLTLQEAFAAAGYATAAFSTNANAGPERATDIGFDSFYDHLAFGGYEPGLRTAPIDQIVTWLEAHRDRPTFVYVHTAEPHSPYEPPPPFKYLFDPDYSARLGRFPLPQGLAMTLRFKYEPRELVHLEALYDGEIAFADHVVGTLHGILGQRGLLDRTQFLVTADHGEEFMEQGRLGHGGGVNVQLLKVPLVLWGEGIPAAATVDANVQLLDLMPTLLELHGIEVEAPLQGDSLVPLIEGRDEERFARRPILAATYMPDRPRFTLIDGSWKLNVQAPGRYKVRLELFDLAADPGEQEDLATERPDILAPMLRRLAQLYGDLPAYQGQTADSYRISQEQIERLRALGYLQ